ncbi:bifunctional GNAT family N-acetyltransferase/acetate--CoA ligase family protein [Streptomyces rapamycinicus]|nr:bifunctional GNAT family N-acetyltransferase/acetate--CoA ligase family protein [Streptomyces rapamycinicus]MBB4782053.1 acyl-CoA synthetase (NDP forming)/GNAT superfamily N-acetyltransferase [Streptomyces rapamycinicus]UTO62599.1 GNAT family N-acetyltransferase [Streptomyces rapamycinicus]UTP30554.1 GNAT family N-acetyltransferase [Streptomyces rapamycinicus NRRL 5491]
MRSPSDHHAYPTHWEADVVLRDGGTAQIRPITTDDAQRLVSFYERVSDESKYYRFFAPYPRLSDRDVHRFTHHDYVDRVGLAAIVGDEFIATVRYDRIDGRGMPAAAPADEAEVAFLVQDAHQGRGVASALLEHIAAVARERGIRRFAAEVLPANNKMIKVFTDAGYTQKRSFEDGVVRLEFDLEPTDRSLAVMRAREQRAEARSVQRLLAPGSVAVIGTSRTPGGVGRTVLRNLLDAGFTGRVHAVNHAFPDDMTRLEPEGVLAHRSLRAIEEPVDLAVVAVPAERVPAVVAECGDHGVQGLVVLSAGYAESGGEGRDRQRDLVRQARSYGMRVIGPNAFGVINTADGVRLNASLSPQLPNPGRLGLFTQSGAIGIALLSGLNRRGAGLASLAGIAGISTFVSAGNRADVSGNDLLQYWYDDPLTDVVLMYLESIGNPRKFTRLARRTAAVKPVVVVKGARHTGSAPTGHAVPTTRIPDATVSDLLRQAGVIRVDTVTELADTGVLLASQPLPAGPRVAILGNSESLGLITYDACLTEELRPLPPRDLTTDATPDDFRRALTEALADDTCDAVVVTAIPWVGDGSAQALAAAVREAAQAPGPGPAKPVAVVHLEIQELAQALAGTGGEPAPGTRRIPAYPAAERAVRALAEAVRYARWREEAAEPGRVPEYDDIDEAGAAADIQVLLAPADGTGGDGTGAGRGGDGTGAGRAGDGTGAGTGDGTGPGVELSAADTQRLLARYGVSVLPALPAPGPDAAVKAAERLGFPVALKPTASHLRHRADLGGVRLELGSETELRRAYAELTGYLGRPEELGLVVQRMAPRGVDTVVRAAIDPAAGAVLSFGLAGAPSELLGDTAHGLVPVTGQDAAELIRSIRTAPLLFGWRGSKPVDTAALEELLLRVSRLVDDHPEMVAVDLEPVVVAQHGLSVLGASARLAPPPPRTDLGPRHMPAY